MNPDQAIELTEYLRTMFPRNAREQIEAFSGRFMALPQDRMETIREAIQLHFFEAGFMDGPRLSELITRMCRQPAPAEYTKFKTVTAQTMARLHRDLVDRCESELIMLAHRHLLRRCAHDAELRFPAHVGAKWDEETAWLCRQRDTIVRQCACELGHVMDLAAAELLAATIGDEVTGFLTPQPLLLERSA